MIQAPASAPVAVACQSFRSDEKNLPLNVEEIFKSGVSGLLTVCGEDLDIVTISSVPVETDLVCFYDIRRIFKNRDAWNYIPPKEKPYLAAVNKYYSERNGVCEDWDSNSYVFVSNLSERDFLKIRKFWTNFEINPEKYYRGLMDDNISDFFFRVKSSKIENYFLKFTRYSQELYDVTVSGERAGWNVRLRMVGENLHIDSISQIAY